MAKSFKTKQKDRKVVEFDLDGATLYARQPKSTSLLDLYERGNSGSSIERLDAARSFIDDCLLPESADLINNRLADPDDDFELEDLTEILNWLTEEFLSPPRPTGPSSESSTPRRRTGHTSTGRSRSRASTPATSTPADSSTPSPVGSASG